MNPLAIGPPTLDTLLALAAMMLGLSLAVQVIQELYKYLANTKAATYRMVLRDSVGPWLDQLYSAGPASALQVRGPFQFFRSRPQGILLPMKKEELLEAMDMVASDWLGFALETLKQEVRLQTGPAPASPHFEDARKKIAAAGEEANAEGRNARQVDRFLDTWLDQEATSMPRDNLDAPRLLEAFYQEFFPDRQRVERQFGQIERNFAHAYNRRNLLLSFIFGLLVALWFPFDALYRQASSLSPEEVQSLAQTLIEASKEAETANDQNVTAALQSWTEILSALSKEEKKGEETTEEEIPPYSLQYAREQLRKGKFLSYLFYCLVTALLISFGAPFWHRLTEALLRTRNPNASPQPTEV